MLAPEQLEELQRWNLIDTDTLHSVWPRTQWGESGGDASIKTVINTLFTRVEYTEFSWLAFEEVSKTLHR